MKNYLETHLYKQIKPLEQNKQNDKQNYEKSAVQQRLPAKHSQALGMIKGLMIVSLACLPMVYAQAVNSTTSTTATTSAPSAPNSTPNIATPTAASAASNAASVLAAADISLLSELAAANAAEIELGKLAATRSKNPQIKAFAKNMVTDHGQALEEVRQLAKNKKFDLTTESDAQHKSLLNKLKKLSGAKFDQQYIEEAGINDHRKALLLLERIQTHGKDAELIALAKKLQPTVAHHLEMAQQTSAKIKSGKKSVVES